MSLEDMLVDYVGRNSGVCCTQWDPAISQRLLFNPYNEAAKAFSAHYFLLNAAITETELIGRAENARALMITLHRRFGEGLLDQTNAQLLNEAVRGCVFYRDFGPQKRRLGAVLAEANRWVRQEAGGDLLGYSERFSSPAEYAESLQGIPRMGGVYAEKVWMYLRWLTRPYPDLGIYGFDVRALRVPLTSHVVDVASCLGLCESRDSGRWSEPGYRDEVRMRVTGYASRLFPEDPLVVDYPFYMLGRWMRGQTVDTGMLMEYLVFFDELYRLTGTVPSSYDIVSREASSFEAGLRALLEKQSIMFAFAAQRFNIGDGLTYRPDFILPSFQVQGRTVVLEPHGIWRAGHEVEVVEKLRMFREMFGSLFYLILIVQPNEYTRVRDRFPEAYDDIVESNRMGDLLYMLKTGKYKPIFL